MEQTNKKPKPAKTRLQKRAPAGLQLNDEHNNAVIINRSNFSDACSVIPLLSPLIVSPSDQTAEAGEEPSHGVSVENNEGRVEYVSSLGAWQHPDVDASTEPANLFAFFQSQCALVPRNVQ